jgi:hypothetical protein
MRLIARILPLLLTVELVLAGEDPTVDLGYGKYQGYHDSTSGLNVWKGSVIRHGIPLIYALRH